MRALGEAIAAKQKEIDRVVDSLRRCQDSGRVNAAEHPEGELESLVAEKRRLEVEQAIVEQRQRPRLPDLLPTPPQVIRDYVDNLRERLDRGHVEQVRTGLAEVVEQIEVTPGQTRGERPCYLLRIKGALSRAFGLLSGRRQVLLVAGACYVAMHNALAARLLRRWALPRQGRRPCPVVG